jgi:hypothetical protein
VIKKLPSGEISPNLVTLAGADFGVLRGLVKGQSFFVLFIFMSGCDQLDI